MNLVPITPKYYEAVRLLRNNPLVKSGFIVQSDISAEDQVAYMEKHHKEYWVCLDGYDYFMGYIGVVDNDIRVCVAPEHQGKGVAKFMVDSISRLFPKAQAKILINNAKSLNLFMKSGYKIKYYLLERE